MEAFLNTKDNHSLYNQAKKQRVGYCMNCNKPEKVYIYCWKCSVRMIMNGQEGFRVKIGEVGRSVINYQQSLHRRFFKCNANINYRGLKKDRIRLNISQETIEKAQMKLHKLLIADQYMYLGKPYTKNKLHNSFYKQIKDVRNISKRLLYNIILYYISYYIVNNKSFRTYVHFQSSMIMNIHINIENTHLRVNKGNIKFSNQTRLKNRMKYYYWLFEEVNKLVSPIMESIATSPKNHQ